MNRYTITVTARYQVTAPTAAAALALLADRAQRMEAALTLLAWDAACDETGEVLSCARTKPEQGRLV